MRRIVDYAIGTTLVVWHLAVMGWRNRVPA
jgi:hypothetical protein